MTAIAAETLHRQGPVSHRVPLTRVTQVELRKMFNTRSGFWLIASIAISAVLATGGVILWAPDDQLTYSTFATAIRFPAGSNVAAKTGGPPGTAVREPPPSAPVISTRPS